MKEKECNKGITLIALVITIIVLLILVGISISTLTGENGILTKAVTVGKNTDISETKEQIKLEIMGNLDENGEYTNTNVIDAVKKVTDKEITENTQTVLSKKGNNIDISDLWKNSGVNFVVCGLSINCEEGTSILSALTKWYEVHGAVLRSALDVKEMAVALLEDDTIYIPVTIRYVLF